jgi:ribosomal protein S18 acetylase RimI-like enzyme
MVCEAVKVREAQLADLQDIKDLDELCFGTLRFSENTILAFLIRDDAFSLLASEGDEIIGAAMCMFSKRRREGRMASIAVSEGHRREGIGSTLLKLCEERLRSQGIQTIWLEVDVENLSAINLYLKHGYVLKAMIKNYYSNGRHAFAMEKVFPSEKKKVKVRPS